MTREIPSESIAKHLSHIERNTRIILANRKHLFSGDEAKAALAAAINRELGASNRRRWGLIHNDTNPIPTGCGGINTGWVKQRRVL
ncbi:MAG: hypothetical protein DRP65_07980 [Planctomycetota bacterium]|nr:MAG: hypothetical protein DRP65_07980 [Planctomycetota bacterium]